MRVADYLLDKDKLFAQLTLDEEEFALYEQVYARLAVDAPLPDLVIYLQAPVDILRERIERRGIKYEQNIERNYLERLQETYARFFHAYDASPLLIVNAAPGRFRQQRPRLRAAAGAGHPHPARAALLQPA